MKLSKVSTWAWLSLLLSGAGIAHIVWSVCYQRTGTGWEGIVFFVGMGLPPLAVFVGATGMVQLRRTGAPSIPRGAYVAGMSVGSWEIAVWALLFYTWHRSWEVVLSRIRGPGELILLLLVPCVVFCLFWELKQETRRRHRAERP